MGPPAGTGPSTVPPPRSDPTRRLVRGSTLLLLGRLIAKLGNFAAQILIVRYLSQSAFGAFAYALVAVTLVQNIITLGLDRAIVRFLPIFHEERDYRRLFGTIALAVAVILSLGLVAALVLYGFQGFVGTWVRDESSLALLLILIFLAPAQALDDLLIGMFAIFAKPHSIFFRRYLLAPGLKLAVVLGLILTGSSVYFLAAGYLASTLLGLGIYGYQLVRVFRNEGLLQNLSIRNLIMPWRQVLGFSIPLLTSDLVYVAINATNVLLLGHFWDTTSVAALSAVQPTARMNEIVMASFATLFTPMAARMFAKDDRMGINDLYWRTAIWIAVFSFPIFAVTFSLAQPITILLFGARYEQSAPILALLSLGYYFNAALGFNGLTLKVFGRVRYLVLMNLATAAISVVVSLLLIPRLGALGAGIGSMVALVVHNLLKQAGLRLETGVSLFERQYARVYLVITLCALGLLAFQVATSAPVFVSLAMAVVAALIVLRVNGKMVQATETFPEAMRLPGVAFLVSGRWRMRSGIEP
jgi:O-antigen/teichoic acid export membrane protein